MQERFDQKYIAIDLETSTLLQDMLLRVPEPINMVCSEILNSLQSTTVTQQDIVNALDLTLEGRRGRFQTLLSLLSESEEDLLVALQKHGPIKAITGKDFLKHVDLSASGVRKVAEKLENSGVIESTREGYKIVDPLLGCFIDRYY